VVNIITWNKAYSIFPDYTFLEHETFMLQSLNDSNWKGLLKYGDRRWKNRTSAEDERPAGKILPQSLEPKPFDHFRRVGDSKTWMVELDIEVVGRPSTPDFVLEHAYFATENATYDIGRRRRRIQPSPSFYVNALEYTNSVLQYNYTQDDSHQRHEDFWHDIKGKLDQLTKNRN
jgi:hypothetical protein